MLKFTIFCALLLIAASSATRERMKRVLPINKDCDPNTQACRKGDWIAENIADCRRRGLTTCSAQNGVKTSWIVDVAKDSKCVPVQGLRFECGAPGTDTRCVCSDTNPVSLKFNSCQCQYWPPEDVGVDYPAHCTGFYQGGTSGVHHWACCNNCNDPSNTCDRETWQGGSTEDYCTSCGEKNGRGRTKYFFNCGGCANQQICSDYCSGPIRNLPGLCWKWLDCFKGCCLQTAQQPSNSMAKRQISAFCGDGRCDSNESPTTCPTDCCYQVNSMCTGDNICTNECCGSPSCCLEGTEASTLSTAALSAASQIKTSLEMMLIMIVLASLFYK